MHHHPVRPVRLLAPILMVGVLVILAWVTPGTSQALMTYTTDPTAPEITPPQVEQRGPILLQIRHEDAAGEEVSLALDGAMLRDLPAETVITSTPWTDGPRTFRGPPLAALLAALGHEGKSVQAFAINDYSVTIPGEAIGATWPIVAYEMDGAPLSRRSKGPLWVIYPYDQAPEFRTETTYSRSIWQLNRLSVLPE